MVEKPTDSQKREKEPVRDEKGRILPGSPGLPGAGRPKGTGIARIGFMEAAQRWADKRGISLQTATAKVIGKLYSLAEGGDIQAIKLFLDRVVGPLAHKGDPLVSVDARSVNINQDSPDGPPVPTWEQLRANIAKLAELALKDVEDKDT